MKKKTNVITSFFLEIKKGERKCKNNARYLHLLLYFLTLCSLWNDSFDFSLNRCVNRTKALSHFRPYSACISAALDRYYFRLLWRHVYSRLIFYIFDSLKRYEFLLWFTDVQWTPTYRRGHVPVALTPRKGEISEVATLHLFINVY